MDSASEPYPVFVGHCAIIYGQMFSHVQKSDVTFVEEMGPSYTHLQRVVRGVVEHPQLDSCAQAVRPHIR